MKYLIILSFLAASLTSTFAQGLINFYNTPSTLISDRTSGPSLPISASVGNYFFALLTSPVGADTFSFAGMYATNTMTPGMINGGSGVSVPGWAAGTARDYVVFGWTAGSGVKYNSSWLNPDLSFGANFPPVNVLSLFGTGVAGGVTASGTVPTFSLFGGPTGIQSGFALSAPVPEPSSTVLLALGAAAVLTRYRGKSLTR